MARRAELRRELFSPCGRKVTAGEKTKTVHVRDPRLATRDPLLTGSAAASAVRNRESVPWLCQGDLWLHGYQPLKQRVNARARDCWVCGMENWLCKLILALPGRDRTVPARRSVHAITRRPRVAGTLMFYGPHYEFGQLNRI